MFGCLGAAGCASSTPQREPESAPSLRLSPGEKLLEAAQSYAAQGQSVRAEQYFLAAVKAGVPESMVFPLLLKSCVESGRLRSALAHVEARLRVQLDEPSLLQLAASLSWALELERSAFAYVERLQEQETLSLGQLLFLGEFYETRAFEPQAARLFYSRALSQFPRSESSAWIRAALRRLERPQSEPLLIAEGAR